ncbi:restriction endonuclease subunit S [Gallintestinimicrobium sp.]|uniref:restriction endonuclease subunit S n=1 Tax=Gallintestinimicrobium sp. TaxID=2981655 RepID=UPI003994B45C
MAKPIIRFKGYQDDWEQRKLSELLVERNVQHSQSEEFPLVSFTVENGVTPKTERYEREQLVRGDKSAKKYKETRLDDIVYNPANLKFGAISRNKLGNAVFSPIYVTFEVKKDLVKPSFIEMVVTRKNFIQKALQYQQGTVYERMAVNTEDFTNLDVYIPNGFEQEKIGNYFENLDNLITLHQRKCDETKKLKKYMLQKMFPQNGEKVPEIRFSGFTDDWEQRKLEDIAEFSKGSGYSKGDLIESGTPIILYGRLYTKYETSISEVDTYVEAKDGSVYSKGGEVIVPASGETAEDIARAATVDKSGVILGGDLNVVSPNEDINSAFLAISISHGNSQRELAKKAQGKSVVHIHNEEIKNLVVPFPANAEQNKIVEYFSNLDHLITLHQRELENLQNIKKFMLGKMFV